MRPDFLSDMAQLTVGVYHKILRRLLSMRKKVHRIIITWEYQRVPWANLPNDHPVYRGIAISNWLGENAQGKVFLIKYDKVTHKPKQKVELSNHQFDFTDYYRLASYWFIRGAEDIVVNFLDLEFETEEDMTLFSLAWADKIANVEQIHFVGK